MDKEQDIIEAMDMLHTKRIVHFSKSISILVILLNVAIVMSIFFKK